MLGMIRKTMDIDIFGKLCDVVRPALKRIVCIRGLRGMLY